MCSPTRWRRGSCATCTAIRAACAARRGSGTTSVLDAAHDDARVALVAEVRPRPIEHDDEAVAEVDEKVDVRDEPHEPRREAREVQPADHHHGGIAADGGELAVVAILEPDRRLALDPAQHIAAGVPSHLLRRRGDAPHAPPGGELPGDEAL